MRPARFGREWDALWRDPTELDELRRGHRLAAMAQHRLAIAITGALRSRGITQIEASDRLGMGRDWLGRRLRGEAILTFADVGALDEMLGGLSVSWFPEALPERGALPPGVGGSRTPSSG